jgi:hypothetical protein
MSEWTVGNHYLEVLYGTAGKPTLESDLHKWNTFVSRLRQIAGPYFQRFEWSWDQVTGTATVEVTWDNGQSDSTHYIGASDNWAQFTVEVLIQGPAVTMQQVQALASIRPDVYQACLEHDIVYMGFVRT